MLDEVTMFQFLLFLSPFHFAGMQSAVVSYKKWMLHVSWAETIVNMRSSLNVPATQIIQKDLKYVSWKQVMQGQIY